MQAAFGGEHVKRLSVIGGTRRSGDGQGAARGFEGVGVLAGVEEFLGIVWRRGGWRISAGDLRNKHQRNGDDGGFLKKVAHEVSSRMD